MRKIYAGVAALCVGSTGTLALMEYLVLNQGLLSQPSSTPLFFLTFAALMLTIIVPCTLLVSSFRPGSVSALSRLRPRYAAASLAGFLLFGLLGVMVWRQWANWPLCMSSEPMSAYACPPDPFPPDLGLAGDFAVLIAFLLLILIPCSLLVIAYLRQPPKEPPTVIQAP